MKKTCDDCKNLVTENGKKFCSTSWSYDIAKELSEVTENNINFANGCSTYKQKEK